VSIHHPVLINPEEQKSEDHRVNTPPCLNQPGRAEVNCVYTASRLNQPGRAEVDCAYQEPILINPEAEIRRSC
jgi:hypothetical protein